MRFVERKWLRSIGLTVVAVLFEGLLGASGVLADDPSAKPDGRTPLHTPLQIECSRQADEKDLHGQARFNFRKDCLSKKTDTPVAPAPASTCKKYSIIAGGMIDAPCD